MKVTVAIDSFKGSLTSVQAGNAAREGVLRVYPQATVMVLPVADGGEGTVDALVSANNMKINVVSVTGPAGTPVTASYGISGKKAIMEMSRAAGITLVNENERDPQNTTTFGVGQMILDALDKGARNFTVGIGGSATNDGGIGMLAALGFEFLNENGQPVSVFGKGLRDICSIRCANADPRLKQCSFTVACDVKNPLCGPNGCSNVYGPQKGLKGENITKMDEWLKNFADITRAVFPAADPFYPGAGAAGGLGFAFKTYLSARLMPGIDIVLEGVHAEESICDSDWVITGEGRLDGQSVMGKVPVGIAAMAKKYGKKVIAVAGAVTDDAVKLNSHGIDCFFPILKGPCSLENAMDTATAKNNLTDTVAQIFNLIKLQEV